MEEPTRYTENSAGWGGARAICRIFQRRTLWHPFTCEKLSRLTCMTVPINFRRARSRLQRRRRRQQKVHTFHPSHFDGIGLFAHSNLKNSLTLDDNQAANLKRSKQAKSHSQINKKGMEKATLRNLNLSKK